MDLFCVIKALLLGAKQVNAESAHRCLLWQMIMFSTNLLTLATPQSTTFRDIRDNL